jgi:hypothetical protein
MLVPNVIIDFVNHSKSCCFLGDNPKYGVHWARGSQNFINNTGWVTLLRLSELYTSSKSLDTNVTTLKAAYIKTEAWLQSAGLSSDIAKREIMHYSRRRGDNSSPSITLQDNDGITRTVTPTATVRWLGVYFDRKLRFEHHAKLLAARGENTVSSFTMLANTIRGLSHAHLRQLYIACVTPKILYACPAWWTGKQYQIRPLERVQRRALRLICAAFKTTPIHALELEASIPPIHIQAQSLARINPKKYAEQS